MTLPKFTISEINSEIQMTVSQAVKFSGRDTAFIIKAIRLSEITPIASIKTGKPGRPPNVFVRAELLNAISNSIQEEIELKEVQTNSEVLVNKKEVI